MSNAKFLDLEAPQRPVASEPVGGMGCDTTRNQKCGATIIEAILLERNNLHCVPKRDIGPVLIRACVRMRQAQDVAKQAVEVSLQSNGWLSEIGTPTGFVTFDLGTILPLSEFRLWNMSAIAGGRTDLVDFSLYSDDDDDPTNGTTGLLGSFSAEVFDSLGNQPMQVFGISATTQFIQMEITSNLGGGNATSFGEAAFVSPVPEPSTIALFTMAGLVGAIVAWRKRSRATRDK